MKPMIEGTSIALRAWDISDIHKIQNLKNDIEMQTHLMGMPTPNSAHKTHLWLKNKDKSDHLVFFVIADKKKNLPIGYIQLSSIDKMTLSGYLGICLSEDFWGTGAAKESLSLLTQYSMEVLNLRKISLLVKHDNARAIQFYKKMSYTIVGVLKKHQLIQGIWTDVIMMERLLTP